MEKKKKQSAEALCFLRGIFCGEVYMKFYITLYKNNIE